MINLQSGGGIMHGGFREGAGRKHMKDKKQPVTIYLKENDKEVINQLPLPNCSSFSQRCRVLINMGISALQQELVVSSNEVTFIDLFSGLGGIRIGFEQALTEMGLTGKCVFSSDIKESAIKAYKHNFNEDAECDITKSIYKLANFDFYWRDFRVRLFASWIRFGFPGY